MGLAWRRLNRMHLIAGEGRARDRGRFYRFPVAAGENRLRIEKRSAGSWGAADFARRAQAACAADGLRRRRRTRDVG